MFFFPLSLRIKPLRGSFSCFDNIFFRDSIIEIMAKNIFKHRTIRPNKTAFSEFLNRYWFAPQDVLLRAVESSIFEAVNIKHPILDVGVGDASIAGIFFPKKLVIDVGCDIDAEGIKRAQGNKKYKKIVVENAERLSFPNSKFASVICNSTAEHITKDGAAIKEFGRVLKKDGLLFLTVPSVFLQEVILEVERFEGNPRPGKTLEHFNKRLAHKHYHTLEEWKKMLAAGKLEIIFHKYYFPEPTTRTWYHSMKFSIAKIAGREMWSWIGHSRFTNLIPKDLVIWYLQNIKLRRDFYQGIEAPEGKGGMLYILARKK